MPSIARALQVLLALGFVALVLRVVSDYMRYRDRARRYLAFAVGALAVVPALAALRAFTPFGEVVLADVALMAFLLSGYGLLLFRHAFLPLPRAVRLAVLGTVTAAGGFAILVRTAVSYEGEPTTLQLVGAVVVSAVFVVCVVEPIFRFWVAARGRPRVQRLRLRLISIGYACIVLLLIPAFASRTLDLPAAADVARQVGVLLVVPMLYASLVPPAWLRRIWRGPEEMTLRSAMEDLIIFSTTVEELASRALEGAERLVGAEAGFLCDARDVAVGRNGLTEEAVERLVHAARWKGEGLVLVDDEEVGGAIVVSLSTSGDRGWLGVVSGPFTPLFASDEVERLRGYAVSVAVALDRVALNERIREQTARHEAVLRAMGDLGIGLLIGEGGRILHANQAVCELTGYTEDALREIPFQELVAPEVRAEALERARRRGRGDAESAHFDTVVLRRDGGRVEVTVGSRPLDGPDGPIVGIVQNISQRKRAEAELRRQKEFAERVIESSIDGVLAYDREYRFTIWNRGMEEISGVPKEDVLGRNMFEAFPFLVEIGEDVNLRRALEGHEALVEDRPFSVPETGRQGYFAARYVPLRAADGTIVGGLGVIRDVTEEKQVIERLRGLNEMKDAFLTAVSHELRTPLTAVLGFSETMRTSMDDLPAARRTEFLDRLIQNAERLDQLLADLLDVDRLTRGMITAERERADLGAVVLRTIERSGLLGRHRLSVEVEQVVVPIDVPKIERCVENLLANAEKHTPSGTDVWVRVRERPAGALLIVEDAGSGVPDEQKERVFGAFHQGDEAPAHSPGVGIGLTLTARFVQLHGGRIWVEDRRGGGASFRIFLPAVEGPPSVPIGLEIGSPVTDEAPGAEVKGEAPHSP